MVALCTEQFQHTFTYLDNLMLNFILPSTVCATRGGEVAMMEA